MNDYSNEHIREVCHGVKDYKEDAIQEMVDYFVSLNILDSSSVIIPAPQHQGYAIYTKSIADRLGMITGAKVLDVLRCVPHETLYSQKLQGKFEPPQMFLTENVEVDGDYFFLDNVIATGTTFAEANKLFGNKLKPLIYAIDKTKNPNI